MVGCTQKKVSDSAYGADASYFYGLQAIKRDDEQAAIRHFKQTVKKGSPFFVRKSLEQLTLLGTSQEQLRYAKDLYQRFPDENSITTLCKTFFNQELYNDVINYTEKFLQDLQNQDGEANELNLTIDNLPNDFFYYRCLSLYRQESDTFKESYEQWLCQKKYSKWQAQFYADISEQNRIELATLRQAVFDKDYTSALPLSSSLLQEASYLKPIVISDIAKVFLYGSKKYAENADKFKELSKTLPKDCVYLSLFYAGRMYDRGEVSIPKAMECYKAAMEQAATDAQYDEALWYYLTITLKDSISLSLTELHTYCSKWHDKDYFDDFLDTLSLRLITKHLWEEYYETAKAIDGYASDEACAKFNYVAGSLVENKYFTIKNVSAKEACAHLYTRALSGGTDFYYRLMAAKKLGLDKKEVRKMLENIRKDTNFCVNEDAERLICGYVDFDLPEFIYPEWEIYADSLSIDCVKKASTYLLKCAKKSEDKNLDKEEKRKAQAYYYKSLRIASKKAHLSEAPIDEELLSLAFPRDFKDRVHECCQKYSLSEYLMFSLMRCESFFNTEAYSSAAALGLTQFIKPTADDVAKKLKYETYDLTDSDTSILFGVFYLSELIERLDNIPLHAILAYNGGANRVRSWRKTAVLVFDKQNIPNDLFLEAVPFTETRNYGRRVSSIAAIYAILYYNKTSDTVLDEIMR